MEHTKWDLWPEDQQIVSKEEKKQRTAEEKTKT